MRAPTIASVRGAAGSAAPELPAIGARQPRWARHMVARMLRPARRNTAGVYDGARRRATRERLAPHVYVQHRALTASVRTLDDADHVVLVPRAIVHDLYLGARLGDAAHQRVDLDGRRVGLGERDAVLHRLRGAPHD